MKEKVRFIFVDLLRGWALLVMIEVHVFNVMLLPSLKQTGWFTVLNFINGLVAPSFLFISGFAFMLSTQNKNEELRKFKFSFWKKLGRIFLILLAGYSLHLPILSLRRLVNYYSPDVILRIYNVDILQCIAAGLLILFAARILIKSDTWFNTFTITVFIITSLIASLVWQIDFGNYFPVLIAAYFSPKYGSLFPLFPWLGFLFAGAIMCKYYLDSRENNREEKYIKNIFISGLVLALLGHVLLSGITPLSFHMMHPHPLFFFQRLGYVMILTALCWYYVERRKTTASFVLDVGRESLLVYWLHLQIIYRKIINGNNLSSIYGGTFDVLEAVVATILLAILMIITAKYWGMFKKKYRTLVSNLTLGLVSLCIIIFLIGF